MDASRSPHLPPEAPEPQGEIGGELRDQGPRLQLIALPRAPQTRGLTMGFEAENPRVLNGLTPGDSVRFTLQQKGERLFVVAIEKEVRE